MKAKLDSRVFRAFVQQAAANMDLTDTVEAETNEGGIRLVFRRVGKTLVIECDDPEVPIAPRNRRIVREETTRAELPKNTRLRLVK